MKNIFGLSTQLWLAAVLLAAPLAALAQTGVGIGTSTPDRPLTVQGSGANSELLSLKNNVGATKWHYNLLNGGLNLTESAVADYRLFVAAGGRVGIGLNNPTARLDVAGDVNVSTLYRYAGAPFLYRRGAGLFVGTENYAALTPTGFGNTAVGLGGGSSLAAGYNNTTVGYLAGDNLTDGNNNVAVGIQAGGGLTTGSDNIFVGHDTGLNSSTGSFNVGLGAAALRDAAGGYNVALGHASGLGVTTGASNTFVGARTDLSNAIQRSRATALGYGATVNQDDAVVLGDPGNVATRVGIGTPNPVARLDVNGDQNLTGTLKLNTADADKIFLTTQGAAGSKIGHAAGWGVLNYAGPGTSATTGFHSWLTTTSTGYAEQMRLTPTGLALGTGGAAPRGQLDVGQGNTYLVDNPNAGTAQTVYLPGHLYLAPYSGGSGTAYVQARVPNPVAGTSIGLTFRTTQGTALRDALTLSAAGDAAIWGDTRVGNNLAVANNATVTNDVSVGSDVSVGNNVSVGSDLTVAGDALLGLTTVSFDYTLPADYYAEFNATCPAGTRLLSGGGGHRDYNSAMIDVVLNYSGPDPSNPTTRWIIRVDNQSTTQNRAVRVYCTCARIR